MSDTKYSNQTNGSFLTEKRFLAISRERGLSSLDKSNYIAFCK